jgi:hypothetical protein
MVGWVDGRIGRWMDRWKDDQVRGFKSWMAVDTKKN